MHAVLITFESDADLEAVAAPFAAYAEALRDVEGLVMKTWIHDGATLGGFHLFAARADAEAYLEGGLFAGVVANPAFRDFRVRHFGVIDELSARNGAPVLAESTAMTKRGPGVGRRASGVERAKSHRCDERVRRVAAGVRASRWRGLPAIW